jgi:hypothetical protein
VGVVPDDDVDAMVPDTENFAWLFSFAYPDWLAVTLIVYKPRTALMDKVKWSE